MKLSNASREAEERLADFKQLDITDDQRHRNQIEGFKLYFDLLKQVTNGFRAQVVATSVLFLIASIQIHHAR
jgi:hypothetical protein